MKRILITGISGFLGRHIAELAKNDYAVYGTSFRSSPADIYSIRGFTLDIRNRIKVFQAVEKIAPDVIIHTAALNTGNDPIKFRDTNTKGSRNVALAASECNARLIQISSDTVHDGRHAPYDDDAVPSPISEYGKSKANAEYEVLTHCKNTVIVRTSLIYETVEPTRSTATFAAMLEHNQPVRLFRDVVRQPIHRDNLARAVLKLADSTYRGYLNIAGNQAVRREHYELRLMKYWNIDPKQIVYSILAAEGYPDVPIDLRLIGKKATSILAMKFPGFDEVMDDAQHTGAETNR